MKVNPSLQNLLAQLKQPSTGGIKPVRCGTVTPPHCGGGLFPPGTVIPYGNDGLFPPGTVIPYGNDALSSASQSGLTKPRINLSA